MTNRTLYYGSGSPFAWRALLALQEKGLQYEAKLLSFSNGEHKSEEYLALNPRGQVPTLKEDDIVINESLAIVMYLNANYTEVPLLPADKPAQALALQRFFEADTSLLKFISAVSMKFRGQVKTPEDEEKYQSNLAAALEEVKYWDEHLGKSTFAAGDAFSIADINVIPLVLMLERVGATFKDLPNIKRYVGMVKERPSVKNTQPPHWAESSGPDLLSQI